MCNPCSKEALKISNTQQTSGNSEALPLGVRTHVFTLGVFVSVVQVFFLSLVALPVFFFIKGLFRLEMKKFWVSYRICRKDVGSGF